MKKVTITTLSTVALSVMASQAAVTYVDATPGNTTLADGTAMVDGTTGYITSASGAANGLWDLRSFANGGTVFGSNGGGSEAAPRLRTTMSTGLTAGTVVEVYAYFWGVDNAGWRGRASLTDDAGDLAGFNTDHFGASSFSPMTALTNNITGGANPGPLSTSDGSGNENNGYFAGTVLTEEGNRALYQVSLGQVTLGAGGTVNVFIDDLESTSSGNRTWYDGVGFEVVPEPSSTALLGLGGLALMLRRRR